MKKNNNQDVFETTSQYGVYIPELTEEEKENIDNQVNSFIQNILPTMQNKGSLDTLTENINSIGREMLKQKQDITQSNEILARAKSFSSKDHNLNKSLKEYQNTVIDMNIVRNWEEGNPFKKALISLPVARTITKKIIRQKQKMENGQQKIQNLHKIFNEELALIDSDKENIKKERENKFETLKQLKKISYLLNGIMNESKEAYQILLSSKDSEKKTQGELIQRYVYNSALERYHTIQQITLTNLIKYQAIGTVMESFDQIKKEVHRTTEIAIPSLETSFLVSTVTDSNAQTLSLIEGTNKMADYAIASLTNTMKDNQKMLHKLQSSTVIDVGKTIASAREIEQLKIEHEKFMNNLASKIEAEVIKLKPIIENEHKRIENIENKDQLMKKGLDYVKEFKNNNQSETENQVSNEEDRDYFKV